MGIRKALLGYLSNLFGKEELSDCLIEFYCNAKESSKRSSEEGEANNKKTRLGEVAPSQDDTPKNLDGSSEPPEKRQRVAEGHDCHDGADVGTGTSGQGAEVAEPNRNTDHTSQDQGEAAERGATVGAPLPAHRLALCGCSPRLHAQVQRWIQDQPPGSKPVLRVPLDSEDDLPYVMSAVQFIYTGAFHEDDSVGKLLRVRRQAAYLQVEGSAEACDTAVKDRILATAARQGSAQALSGVFALYADRHLLPDRSEEPDAVHGILHACREQLWKNGSSGKIEGVVPKGTPSLAELLGWAFGDAPSVLSDPAVRQQLESLSAAGLEALLGSTNFATDDESSVLLMLATWLQAHPETPEDARKRLCRLIRLLGLTIEYFYVVLPSLPWFPMSAEEYRFICLYAAAETKQRARLSSQAAGSYDCSSPWYSTSARPSSLRVPRKHEWYISEQKIREKLAAGATSVWLRGRFTNGATHVVSLGFELCPLVISPCKDTDETGVYLESRLPPSLRSSLTQQEVNNVVVPVGDARLAVRGALADNEMGTMFEYHYEKSFVTINACWGVATAFRLGTMAARDQTVTGADPLAAWSRYLHDGKLSGLLEWAQADWPQA